VREGFDTAECVVETNDPTLLAILRGEQNVRTATLSGKVRVSGDFEVASRLGQILAKAS
jgi:putative sterol carrier protein